MKQQDEMKQMITDSVKKLFENGFVFGPTLYDQFGRPLPSTKKNRLNVRMPARIYPELGANGR